MTSRIRERLTLLGGTALLAFAVFAAIARRPFRRRRLEAGAGAREEHRPASGA